jgi:hypothetical protein
VWQSFAADADLGAFDSPAAPPLEFMPAEVAPAIPGAGESGQSVGLVDKAPASDNDTVQTAWAWAAFLGGLGGLGLRERRRKGVQGTLTDIRS